MSAVRSCRLIIIIIIIIITYNTIQRQSTVFRDQERECHLWLTQKLHPCKTSVIMDTLEQIVETRSWKVARNLMEDGRCRVCFEQIKTVEHLVTGRKLLANGEYLSRHNRALMILALRGQNNMIWLGKMWRGTRSVESEEQS